MSEAENQEVSVIVPFYNEVENATPLLEELAQTMETAGITFEVVAVNDGSRDGTGESLDAQASADSRVKVVHMRRNYGQTAALMAGIAYSKGDIIVMIDGDRQNDPSDIPKLIEALDEEEADVVSGWRRDRQDTLLTRKIPSRAANALISKLMGVHLHDYGCTLKAYRREFLEGVRLYGDMHRFLPVVASWEGARVAERVVNHRPRTHGTSKYGLGRIFTVLLELVFLYFADRAFDRPIQFFGRAGLAFAILSAISFLAAVWLKLVEGISFILTPLPLLAATLGVSAVICVLLGVLAEMQLRIYFEAQGRAVYKVSRTRNMDVAGQGRA